MLHKPDDSKRMDLYALLFLVLGELGLLFSIFYVYWKVYILFPLGLPDQFVHSPSFYTFFVPFLGFSVVASILAFLAYVDRKKNRFALWGYSMIAAGFIATLFGDFPLLIFFVALGLIQVQLRDWQRKGRNELSY
jgi:hypothetical protein